MQSDFGPYPNSQTKRKDLAKYLFITETTDIFPSKCTDKNCVFNGSSSIFRFLTAITDKAEPCTKLATLLQAAERFLFGPNSAS